ncbi:MAG TPA: flagellar basal body-associated FliL family protein [Rhizomicrobium sp.]|nr:flagellar basal body-associated FliL family protein [Rhizomicrobium sp.]
MAKDKVKKADDSEEPEAEAIEGEGTEPKKGFVKNLLANRKLLIIAGGGALALLLALGGGVYFFLFSGSDSHGAKTASAQASAPIVPPQVAFYDMPDIVVNIQSADGAPAYLKLTVALELAAADEKPGLQVLMPRVVDQFQGYLRELRVDDLRGSAGVMRLKEELLRRINVAADPYKVRDVLLKEIIVQ